MNVAGFRSGRTRFRLGCAAGALLVATGCAPKTKYAVPAVETPAAYKENAKWKPPEPRDTEVRDRWWEMFGDPQLNDLESRIEVSNQTLRAFVAQFEQARALVHGARANLYPQVTAAASVAAVRPSGTRAISSYHEAYLDLLVAPSVTYEADLWGRLHGMLDSARASAQASAADV